MRSLIPTLAIVLLLAAGCEDFPALVEQPAPSHDETTATEPAPNPLAADLEACQAEAATLRGQVTDLKADLATEAAANAKAALELKTATDNFTEAAKAADYWKDLVEHERDLKKRSDEHVAELLQEKKDLVTQLTACGDENRKLTATVTGLQQKLTAAEASIQQLTTAQAQHLAEINRLKQEVEALEEELTRPATEQDYWESIAKLVESGELRHTDEILRQVDFLQERGVLTDLSRVASWRSSPAVIDNSNRAAVLATLLGKEPVPPDPPADEALKDSQLSVLVITEQTGPQSDEVRQAKFWLAELLPGRWGERDDDLDAVDLLAEPEWVRKSYSLPRGSGPWIVIRGPKGGASAPLPQTFQSIQELVLRFKP